MPIYPFDNFFVAKIRKYKEGTGTLYGLLQLYTVECTLQKSVLCRQNRI